MKKKIPNVDSRSQAMKKKKKKLVPMKPRRAWCVVNDAGNAIVYWDIVAWDSKEESQNNRLDGETVRRVRIVEDVK